MAESLQLLPESRAIAQPLFLKEEDYEKFCVAFVKRVEPQQQEWLKARRQSEEDARRRLVG